MTAFITGDRKLVSKVARTHNAIRSAMEIIAFSINFEYMRGNTDKNLMEYRRERA